MPYSLKMDEALGLVIARFEGTVDAAQLDRIRGEIEAHPDFRPGLDRIWDERNADLEVTGDQIRSLADRWNQSTVDHGRRRVGYLVSEGLRWGLNRQFESQRGDADVQYRIFTAWPELRAWLELPEDMPDPATLF